MNEVTAMNFECILSHGASMPLRNYPTDAGLDVTIQGYQRMVNGELGDVTWFDEQPEDEKSVVLFPGRRLLAKTGLRINIPYCDTENYVYEIQVRPKSGLALKKGIMIVNSPGTIDSGYQGDIDIILYNSDIWEHEFKIGQKIAQLVINKVFVGDKWNVVEKFTDKTVRGNGGFGSTGLY